MCLGGDGDVMNGSMFCEFSKYILQVISIFYNSVMNE